ncbi:MAG: enoyl-CoA hydratase/isomerase family protein [Chloroflexota bacterium]
MTSTFETLIRSQDGPVATLVLNRPEKLNAINRQMDAELAQALHEAEEDGDVRVVVLKGAGERAFSAGVDTKEGLFPRSYVMGDDWNPYRGAHAAHALLAFPKPVIAAIHGYCLGGATELILHADFRVAAEDAVLAFPEAALGMAPGWGGSQLLPRIVGRATALDLLLTSRRVSGREAASLGLVNEAVPRDQLERHVADRASALAQIPPLATRLIKRAVNAAGEVSVAEGFRLERDMIAYRFAANALADGLHAPDAGDGPLPSPVLSPVRGGGGDVGSGSPLPRTGDSTGLGEGATS